LIFLVIYSLDLFATLIVFLCIWLFIAFLTTMHKSIVLSLPAFHLPILHWPFPYDLFPFLL
jgi:hypothetical protein